ncbi:uncharacterized protein P174DRAFT_11042 [Aspergillus novofumigatus IBT 16806]|uniref:Uncharacterized protein n=1 Tax=Aspergillus novofumigatus (strain IBT 16806) TaxID=1392255 RepID=A0A2I1CKY3_ASPN1|nr:uncharacterized protein P174DRAFT_11042 [Aspergillus novofumigatus IBT 16806]PKX98288.1 hypothetical protein P174DRAFT_11042 [Aspergillus novofumigatus IBT 16806]
MLTQMMTPALDIEDSKSHAEKKKKSNIYKPEITRRTMPVLVYWFVHANKRSGISFPSLRAQFVKYKASSTFHSPGYPMRILVIKYIMSCVWDDTGLESPYCFRNRLLGRLNNSWHFAQ